MNSMEGEVWWVVAYLVGVIAWPLVAAFAVFYLRKPLVELINELPRRIQKFQFYNLSIELATVSELSTSWNVNSRDVRKLTPSEIFDSLSFDLFDELAEPTTSDYAIIDLGSGQDWLTSRLFIFAMILGLIGRVQIFVFLTSSGEIRRKFLGIATPFCITKALAARYPYLKEACLKALPVEITPIEHLVHLIRNEEDAFAEEQQENELTRMRHELTKRRDELEEMRGFILKELEDEELMDAQIRDFVRAFVQEFLKSIQKSEEPLPNEKEAYLQFTDFEYDTKWERTRWIDGNLLQLDLAGCLDYSRCEDSKEKTRNAIVEMIARQDGDFVVLVDQDGRFKELVNRHALLDQMFKHQDN